VAVLKVMADQKNFNEVALLNESKEKEKMTVLFMEVVRLADTVEKMEAGMGTIGRNYESRLQEL
jgi:hypothetical protein